MKETTPKYFYFVLVLCIISSLFFLSFFKFPSSINNNEEIISNNISYISNYDKYELNDVEQMLNKVKVNDTSQSSNSDSSSTSNDSISYFQSCFENSIVIGDSITEGLVSYRYLTDAMVIHKIGASLLSSDSMFQQAKALQPKAIFFSFGMNDTGYFNGEGKLFAKKYKEIIVDFKAKSPSTEIYINSILPPSDEAIRNHPSYGNYKDFNKHLQLLCSDLKITYIDNTQFLVENPQFYAGDGIHVSPKYYPLWLNNMIEKAGLS